MTNWDEVRQQFPALVGRTYLNTATFGQLPKCATEAMVAHLAHRDELACADFLAWFDDMDRVRGLVGRLIGAGPEDIAFIGNSSTGLSILLSGIDWAPGDRVLTLDDEFPNQLYGLGDLATQGVEFVSCPWERFYDSFNERTRLVALSTVNYNTGFAPPLAQISEYLHDRGILFYLDGTQSMGALRMDVGKVRPDMLSVHGYKWLLSPNGAGFLYVRPELRAWLQPNVVGWRSHWDWRSVDNLHHGAPVFSDKAERYEGGMLSFALLYGMGASIEMMLQIGVDEIESRVMHLAGLVRKELRSAGATVCDFDSPIVAGRFAAANPSEIAAGLKARGVMVAARKGQLRVSPHFYNTEADVERFGQELRALAEVRAPCTNVC